MESGLLCWASSRPHLESFYLPRSSLSSVPARQLFACMQFLPFPRCSLLFYSLCFKTHCHLLHNALLPGPTLTHPCDSESQRICTLQLSIQLCSQEVLMVVHSPALCLRVGE